MAGWSYAAGLLAVSLTSLLSLPSCSWSPELLHSATRPVSTIAWTVTLAVSLGLPLILLHLATRNASGGTWARMVDICLAIGSAAGAVAVPMQLLRFAISDSVPNCGAGPQPIALSLLFLLGIALVAVTIVVGIVRSLR